MARFGRKKQRSVRDVLVELGVDPEVIEEAERAGTAELLAIDGVVLPERQRYTLAELAAKVDTDVEVIRTFWRALGFVEPDEGEQAFNRRDVAILKSLGSLSRDGLIDRDVSLQVARVLGLAMAGVATAVVDASEARTGERREQAQDGDGDGDDPGADDPGSLAVRAGELLPFLTDVIDYAFRRHLRAAARRRVVAASNVGGLGQVIGFADLVRFTELSGQLDERELATLVGRFDEVVNEIVVRHGGRIVKMIGDAAMFTALDPVDGALLALELSETVEADDVMSGLRIGMANGPVLRRDGDLYGPVVNLASRLADIGRGGAVNVSHGLRDAIAHDRRFELRSLGTWKLRHIGDERVYRLRRRRAEPATPAPAATAGVTEPAGP